ncbi:MAG: hypothetical protein U1A27_01295 [Phycisphaerae bacterium]
MVDQSPRQFGRDDSLGVVLQADHAAVARQRLDRVAQPRGGGGVERRGVFGVDADHLLAVAMLGQSDEARLARGGAAGPVEQAARGCAASHQKGSHVSAGGVIAEDAETGDRVAQGGDVGRDRAGAAKGGLFADNADDGHGRFGADAFGVAVEVGVEHEVADDGDRGSAGGVEELEKRLPHGVWTESATARARRSLSGWYGEASGASSERQNRLGRRARAACSRNIMF